MTLLNPGTQERLISETVVSAGTTVREGSTLSDAILVTLWVSDLPSGTLDVSVVTLTDEGREGPLLVFPTLSAPTANLVIKQSSTTLQRYKVRATYSGSCSYEVYVRAISSGGGGTSNVRIVGADDWLTDQVTVTSAPTLIIPPSLLDRAGVLVKNWSTTTDVFIASTAGVSLLDYPLAARDALSLDISAGASVYGITASGSADIRSASAGG